MKKMIVLLFGTIALFLTAVTFAATSVAVVNFQSVMKNYAKVQVLTAKLKSQFAPEQKSIETMQTKLQNLEQTYETTNAKMPKAKKLVMQKTITAKQQALMTQVAAYREKVSAAQQKAMDEVMNDIKGAVAKVAKKENIDIVIASAAAPYAAAKCDLTAKVEAALK